MAMQITVTHAGNTANVTAYPYSALPKKGNVPAVAGKLNGQPYTFLLTKGQGRGTVVKYCAYFVLQGRVYYFYTPVGTLPAGAVVVANPAAPVAPAAAPVTAPVTQPVAPATPATPATKKVAPTTKAKTARKGKVTA
jgi:hypothetical protein